MKWTTLFIVLVGFLSQSQFGIAWGEERSPVTNITTRIYDSQYDGMKKVSIRADVTNNSSKTEQFEIRVQGLDKDGFEVEHWDLVGTIDAQQTKQLSSSEDIDEDAFSKIVKWQREK